MNHVKKLFGATEKFLGDTAMDAAAERPKSFGENISRLPDHIQMAQDYSHYIMPFLGMKDGGNVSKDPTNKDSVPAMLTPGEFVANKEAAVLFGPQLEAMNRAGLAYRNMGGTVDSPHVPHDGVAMLNEGGWWDNLMSFGNRNVTEEELIDAGQEVKIPYGWNVEQNRPYTLEEGVAAGTVDPQLIPPGNASGDPAEQGSMGIPEPKPEPQISLDDYDYESTRKPGEMYSAWVERVKSGGVEKSKTAGIPKKHGETISDYEKRKAAITKSIQDNEDAYIKASGIANSSFAPPKSNNTTGDNTTGDNTTGDNTNSTGVSNTDVVAAAGGLSTGQKDHIGKQAMEFFGIDNKSIGRFLLYYMGGRLTGGSHAGSMQWAGKQAINELNARDKTREAERVANNKELREVKKVYRKELRELKSAELIDEKTFDERMKMLSESNDIIGLEESFADTSGYSDLYKLGIRPDTKKVKIMHESSTRPINVYDIGNGQYMDTSGNLYDHSQGYKPHLTEDQIRDDTYQNLEDVKARNDDGHEYTVVSKEDQFKVLDSVSKAMKKRGLADNPVAYTGHLKDIISQMRSEKIKINPQSLEAYMMGTLVTAGDVVDIDKISGDNDEPLPSATLLDFGSKTNELFDGNKEQFAKMGITSPTEMLRRIDAAWDPKKEFDKKEVVKEIKDPKLKSLVESAPNDYMAFVYWSIDSNLRG